MEMLDPATGAALPSDAIQRVLFVANGVHVYDIPPLASNRGYSASDWTVDPKRHIFTARLRVVETSFGDNDDSAAAAAAGRLKVDAVLEDPATGQLFAAAPYTDRAIIESVIDSSRFFAVAVRDPSGRKAVLGIGFEDRSDAFDLSIALQEAAKGLGWQDGDQGRGAAPKANSKDDKKDYSLKDGETITVNLGGNRPGRRQPSSQQDAASSSPFDLQSFALAPPPSGAPSEGSTGLPPPPSAQDIKRKRLSARDLGFDDGKFGEFA